MSVIFADFNAMTEDGRVCLTCKGSQEDIARLRAKVSDQVWVGDGEVSVMVTLADDPYWGLVGVPDWSTTVHLDDDGDPI